MANVGAMGTDLTLTAMDTDIVSAMGYEEAADQVQITGLPDPAHVYLAGPVDKTITLGTKGYPSVEAGDAATATIAFFDGTSKTITNGVVMSVSANADVGGAIEGSVTIKQSTA